MVDHGSSEIERYQSENGNLSEIEDAMCDY